MGSCSATKGGFGFGFHDINFSDRVLCLHVLSSETNSDFDGPDFRLRKIHVNSLVLASKSPFFLKLFKNGMKETQQREEVTFKIINTSEESALMDVLKFMYGLCMSATSEEDLVDVLLAANKFEVPSCVKQCVDLLLKLPMFMVSALRYLGLPSSVSEGELVQPLIDTTKKYLAGRYGNFIESQDELLGSPLCVIEIILGLDGLLVDSEDAVFDFVLRWALRHYPNLEERREILSKHLVRFLCFSGMSSFKIKEMLDCSDFYYGELYKLALDSLLSSDQVRHFSTGPGNPRRVYDLLPIKVVYLEFTQPRCVVYLDIKKQQCANLHDFNSLNSKEFGLGGRVFWLNLSLYMTQPIVALCARMDEEPRTCILTLEFAVMKKYSNEFIKEVKINFLTVSTVSTGFSDFNIPWKEFMSEESEYFIDGILHLRADITYIRNGVV